MSLLDEIRHKLRIVLTGLRHIAAKLLHDFKAHQIIVFVRGEIIFRVKQLGIILQHFPGIRFEDRPLFGPLFDLRVIILSVARDFQQPCHMVDSRNFVLHMILGQPQPV